ncbi:hypothetical protein ABRQ22_06645 [Cellulosimicrobium sp. ES-005]|uniref:Uncharacterized protein n=1 Tax=Cellulosimicrobium sp. ES-005 TaxID=3163031 RepID=A0AAU8G574_9MICO
MSAERAVAARLIAETRAAGWHGADVYFRAVSCGVRQGCDERALRLIVERSRRLDAA